ncbi:MAG TPA: hypothetical protein VIN10_02505 [Bacteroidales bacterium]
MKKLLFILIAALFALNLPAQSVKLIEGKPDFLAGQKVIKVKFVYDENMKIGKTSEKDYIDKKVKDYNKKEAGKGDAWLEEYYNDRTATFEPKFMGYFNQVTAAFGVSLEKLSDQAEYLMIVNTTFIEPGYNIGYMSKNASVNFDITFTPVDDETKVLAKYTLKNSPGGIYGIEFDFATRIGEAYAIGGQYFALTLVGEDVF